MELSGRRRHKYHNCVTVFRFAPRRRRIYVRPGTVWDSFVCSNLSVAAVSLSWSAENYWGASILQQLNEAGWLELISLKLNFFFDAFHFRFQKKKSGTCTETISLGEIRGIAVYRKVEGDFPTISSCFANLLLLRGFENFVHWTKWKGREGNDNHAIYGYRGYISQTFFS